MNRKRRVVPPPPFSRRHPPWFVQLGYPWRKTATGKEAAGWALHLWSTRRLGPFVPVLASALPRNLVADELFGHERHAFTDAASRRAGRFKAADGGTVYLDEVADLSGSVQSALLRVVEYREIARLGADVPLRVDVRVTSSSNRDLARLVRAGQFRPDLYDRLSVFEVRLPSLRDRPEDVRPLARHFLRNHCAEFDRQSAHSSTLRCATCGATGAVCADDSFYAALESYHWPGNVRELKSLILRVVAAHPMEMLRERHVQECLLSRRKGPAERSDWTLNTALRNHIERVLRRAGGNQSRAARLLGLPLSTLRSRMKKLGIEARHLANARRFP